MNKLIVCSAVLLTAIFACGKKDSSSSSTASDNQSQSTVKNSVWLSQHFASIYPSGKRPIFLKVSSDGSYLRSCRISNPPLNIEDQNFIRCNQVNISIDSNGIIYQTPSSTSGSLPPPSPQVYAVLDGNTLNLVDPEGGAQFIPATQQEIEVLNMDMVLAGRVPLVAPDSITSDLPAGSYQKSCPYIDFWDSKTFILSCLDPDYTYSQENPVQTYKKYIVTPDDFSACASHSFSVPVKGAGGNTLACDK